MIEVVLALLVIAAIAGLYVLLKKPKTVVVTEPAPYKIEPPQQEMPVLVDIVEQKPTEVPPVVAKVVEPEVKSVRKPRAPRKVEPSKPTMAQVKSVQKPAAKTQQKNTPAKKRSVKRGDTK